MKTPLYLDSKGLKLLLSSVLLMRHNMVQMHDSVVFYSRSPLKNILLREVDEIDKLIVEINNCLNELGDDITAIFPQPFFDE